MLTILKNLVGKDTDLPDRAWEIGWREEFRTSKIYDRLTYPFMTETTGPLKKEYVPLQQRRPSVRFGLPAIIVNDSTSLLFSEGHFPALECATVSDKDNKRDEKADEFFGQIVKETRLREIMMEAATRGAVGSIAVWMRVLKGRIFWKVLSTQFLTPEWDEEEPDKLVRVPEKYKTKGSALIKLGYAIAADDKDRDFWFQRIWDRQSETWYLPWPVKYKDQGDRAKYPPETVDSARTKVHGLGFVPIEWIKNLPGGDDADGAPTVVDAALCNAIELDYQLSQNGRGLKYAQDPTLVLYEAGIDMGNEPIVRSAGNALRMQQTDRAELLEMRGTASKAVLEYVSAVREYSLELCGGNRSSPEKLSGAQSGRAMELMNQGLIWLADKLRTSYGEGALIGLLRMVLRANRVMDLMVDGKPHKMGSLPDSDSLKLVLKWPPWYAPTAADHTNKATAIKTYVADAGVMSKETAVRSIAHDFDVEDVDEELSRIEGDAKADSQQQIEVAQATKPQSVARPVKEAA